MNQPLNCDDILKERAKRTLSEQKGNVLFLEPKCCYMCTISQGATR